MSKTAYGKLADGLEEALEMVRKLPSELVQGQAAGRPEWQKGLPMDTLIMIDRKANEAMRSDAALDDYLVFTSAWRSGVK